VRSLRLDDVISQIEAYRAGLPALVCHPTELEALEPVRHLVREIVPNELVDVGTVLVCRPDPYPSPVLLDPPTFELEP